MKSLHKVLSIIETVAKVKSAGIREIASLTGYSPSTIHRIVSTLVERRYIVQKYSLIGSHPSNFCYYGALRRWCGILTGYHRFYFYGG